MYSYEKLQIQLLSKPRTRPITGVVGFIGRNLFRNTAQVKSAGSYLNNFSTDHQRILDELGMWRQNNDENHQH